MRGVIPIKIKMNKVEKLIATATTAVILASGVFVVYGVEEEPVAVVEEEEVIDLSLELAYAEREEAWFLEQEGIIQDELVAESNREIARVKAEEELKEQERLAAIKAEEERVAANKAEAERVAANKAEEERVAKVVAEEKQQAQAKAEPKPEPKAQAKAEPEQKEVTTATTSQSSNTSGRSLGTFQATSYTANCTGCSGITANGTNMNGGSITTAAGYRIIAADTRVIPMNTIIKITFSSGQTIMGQVADTGGAIKGNIIDIAQHSHSTAMAFGRQSVTIEVIN